MNKKVTQIVISAVVIIGLVGLIYLRKTNQLMFAGETKAPTGFKLDTFKSSDDFKNYLAQASTSTNDSGLRQLANNAAIAPTATKTGLDTLAKDSISATGLVSDAGRYSTTNVQVLGIDEPDSIKTNGQQIFYGSSNNYPIYYNDIMPKAYSLPSASSSGSSSGSAGAAVPTLMSTNLVVGEAAPASEPVVPTLLDATSATKMIAPSPIMPPIQMDAPKVQVIGAVPAQSLAKVGSIDLSGDLLLSGNVLMVFSTDYYRNGAATTPGIYGYDISDPAKPKQLWHYTYDNNASLQTARLLGGKLYVVVQSGLNYSSPCPIEPMLKDSVAISVPCAMIYHPIVPTTVSNTFTILAIDPATGNNLDKTSFVGNSSATVVSVFPEAIYLAYQQPVNNLKMMLDFLHDSGSGLFPQTIMDKLDRLSTYDISDQAKETEMNVIESSYLQTLTTAQMEKYQKDNEAKLKAFYDQNGRKYQLSAVVKVDLNGLKVAETGEFPGYLQNQFSMDEYQGNLRLASTINNWWTSSSSVNDVYVLNSSLKVVGKVQDLGKGESIYAVRFVGDMGYVVTYRQTDPFYVLDLSNPGNPQQVGELKIPGYSSYLHPIDATHIMGVGMDDQKVKVSLFDVSVPSAPREVSKVSLDAYWSDVQNDYHALLQDSDHQVVFVPAGDKAFVVSYAGSSLSTVKTISDTASSRAVYIGNTLYVVSSSKVVALDESTWKEVKTLEIK